MIRSYRNFNQDAFNQALMMKPWEQLGLTENVNIMANLMNRFLTETLDEIVPMKKVKMHNNHVSALSNETKKLIKERNKARKENSASYKQLRNKCVKLVNRDKRKDTSRKLSDNPHSLWKMFR